MSVNRPRGVTILAFVFLTLAWLGIVVGIAIITTRDQRFLGLAFLIVSGLAILAGIGLLRMKSWGRILSLIIGVGTIPLIFGIVVVWYLMRDVKYDFEETGGVEAGRGVPAPKPVTVEEDLRAERTALKDMIHKIDAKFEAGRLTPRRYMKSYVKHSKQLAIIEAQLAKYDKNISAPRKLKCLYCGSKIPQDAEFCSSCGAARVRCTVCNLDIVSGEQFIKCPHCSTLSHRDHLLEWIKVKGFCPNCLEKLGEIRAV